MADLATVRARVARDLVIDPELVRDATDEGYRTGYNAGFTAGLEDAAAAIDAREQQRRAQLQSLLQQLATAVNELDERHRDVIANIEASIVAVACEVAEVIVGHELATASTPGRDAITRCLRFAPTDGTVIARLHPDDVEAAVADDASATYGHAVRIVADPALARGDAIVDVGPTRVDGRITPALDRIREVLAS